MREYAVVYEQGPTSWGANVPDLPGCFAVGETFDEAQRLIKEAIEAYIETLQLNGQPIPEPKTKAGIVQVAA